MQFRILGSLQATAESHVDFGPPKQRALMAILLLYPNELIPIDQLIDWLWAERAPRTARHSVHTYVSALRAVLQRVAERAVIVTTTLGYELRLDPNEIDAHRFERLIAHGMESIRAGDAATGAASLRAALELWRGPPLVDFQYDEFAQPHIKRLSELRLAAIEGLAEAELATGHSAAVLPLLEQAALQDPLRERVRELQILALYRSGRQADAVRTYNATRTLLADELGVEPSSTLRRLAERILAQDKTLLADETFLTRVPMAPPALSVQTGRPSSRRGPFERLAAATALILVAAVSLGFVLAGQQPRRSVALLFHGGDFTVNRIVEQGFDSAISEFGLLGRKVVVQPDAAQAELRRLAADGFGLVVVLSLETEVDGPSAEHPATKFASFYPTQERANTTQMAFRDNEGSFLVGVAAALTSSTGTIGFIGGVDNATIWAFEAGFEAGARAAKPDIRIESRYLSTPPEFSGFFDPAAASLAARDMYERGADVIFGAAGDSGVGIFEAAVDMSTTSSGPFWAIGVDSDQFLRIDEMPRSSESTRWQGHILTSMVKGMDVATRTVVSEYARGVFAPGRREFGLADGGVDISYSGGFLEGIRAEIERFRASIIAGEIDVPCLPDSRRVTEQPAEAVVGPCIPN